MCSGCGGDVEQGGFEELEDEVSPANPNWQGARLATAGELAFAAEVLAEDFVKATDGVVSRPMSLAELTELCEEAGRVMTEAEAEGYRRRRDLGREIDEDIAESARRRRGGV